MTFWRRFLAFIGIRPRVRWEDGVVVTGAALDRYRTLYAETVAWVRLIRPDAIQAPDFRVTVRLYTTWPVSDGLIHYGKVLAPGVIPIDPYGTMCFYKSRKFPTDFTIIEECKHAITGIGDHPAWLFPNG